MKKIKLAIVGCCGRMGQEIIHALKNFPNCIIVGAVEKKTLLDGKKKIGNIKIIEDKNTAFKNSDIIIDFSTPQSTKETISYAVSLKKKVVIGTTGLNNAQVLIIKKASKKIPIIFAPNMSIGVNLLLSLVAKASKTFFNNASVEILDIHHKDKKDAPSGTALALGETVAKGIGKSLKKISSTKSNNIRKKQIGKINFYSKRQGKTVGEHVTIFTNKNEELELKHKGFNRSIYADGAINAAIWLYKKKKGFYNMFDVLDVR